MQEMVIQSLGQGRSTGEGNGNSLQHSCLGNPLDGGAWRATSTCGCKRVRYDFATKQELQKIPLSLSEELRLRRALERDSLGLNEKEFSNNLSPTTAQ